MREIRLRAWDKVEKRMLYATLHDKNWYATPYNDEKGCHCVRAKHQSDKHNLITVLYTGLKDAKKREIYEGDILASKDYCRKVIVEFDNGCFVVNNGGDRNFIATHNYFEIIGNIYENKDLIDAKEKN